MTSLLSLPLSPSPSPSSFSSSADDAAVLPLLSARRLALISRVVVCCCDAGVLLCGVLTCALGVVLLPENGEEITRFDSLFSYFLILSLHLIRVFL